MTLSYKENYASHLHEPAPVRAELVVRPDLLRVSFSAFLETEGAEQSLPLLQRATSSLEEVGLSLNAVCRLGVGIVPESDGEQRIDRVSFG